ncbi:hypothetical protein SLNSH_10190 [Alsobacter soli]|uniref:Uncharacterized protein n=1 Tax=Alsobacter soli TaxID=2109933 RepID=A0A2T1HU53_9HYPH|nr:hypothetical protein [Alsobacter soli]PSC05174.1 hypothetical protein SLNSH_10190 [Alsobacter soli]
MADEDATASRLAECAALMLGLARLMLDAEPRSFAAWLRKVADDIEAEAAQDEAEAAKAVAARH